MTDALFVFKQGLGLDFLPLFFVTVQSYCLTTAVIVNSGQVVSLVVVPYLTFVII